MASTLPHEKSSGRAQVSFLRYCLLISLLLCSAMVPLSKVRAGEIFPIDILVVDEGFPVPGVIVSIDYFHAVTDKEGRAIFELFAGPYELQIRRTKGASPVTAEIEIDRDNTVFEVDLSQIEQTLAIDPDQPQGLALGTFGDFSALARFWEENAAVAEEGLGDVRAVLDRSGNFAVLAGPPELQSIAELERSLGEARALGFSSSFPLPRESVAMVLSDGTNLAFSVVEERLLTMLLVDDNEVRRGARTALGALGPSAVPGLLAALTGREYRTDLGALVALSGIDGWQAEPDELSRVWNAASLYRDRVIDTSVRDALRAMDADAKLALLGFPLGHEGMADFQTANGLVSDGIVGANTSRALNDLVFATLAKSGGRKWAGFKMAVYGINVDDALFERVKKIIRENGAAFQSGFILKKRPSWLALEPTVFYYARESEQDAQHLAETLSDELGLSFVVQRGAGLGVRKGEERRTFFVHLIGEPT